MVEDIGTNELVKLLHIHPATEEVLWIRVSGKVSGVGCGLPDLAARGHCRCESK